MLSNVAGVNDERTNAETGHDPMHEQVAPTEVRWNATKWVFGACSWQASFERWPAVSVRNSAGGWERGSPRWSGHGSGPLGRVLPRGEECLARL